MPNSPLIIGISGGSGSGKTLFLKTLMDRFDEQEISLLSMDNYYKPIHEQEQDEKGIENFDLPDSLNREKFYKDLQKLKTGEDLKLLEYTYNNKAKTPKELIIKACPIIVVEGIFTLYFEEIRKLLDLKIYIDAPDYLMLTRRITRDSKERGYDLNDVLYRFQHHVTPSFKKFIEPMKHEADIIINNHHGFGASLEVVATYLKTYIK